MAITALRMMRDPSIPVVMPSTTMMEKMPGVMMVTITIRMMSEGMLIQASTKRWVTVSTGPPR